MSNIGQGDGIESCWAEVNGQRFHYLKAGKGPALLLIHGLLGGSFCWRFNIPVLAQYRTVLAVDMAGMGVSDASRKCDCSMQAQAFRLERFLRQEKIDRADVVGSSWGGAVAILLAAGSTSVQSLVLSAPVNPWSTQGRERIRFFSRGMGSFLLRYGIRFGGRYHRPALEAMYGDVSRISPGTLEGYGQLIRRKGRGHNLLNILRHWENDVDCLATALPRVKARALLVWGTCDGAVNPNSAARLQRTLRNARTVTLQGLGHLPFEEDPEVFNRLVLDFVRQPEEAMGN
jgi:pimeloyl-ACP methyl ester carboxylesterase